MITYIILGIIICFFIFLIGKKRILKKYDKQTFEQSRKSFKLNYSEKN